MAAHQAAAATPAYRNKRKLRLAALSLTLLLHGLALWAALGGWIATPASTVSPPRPITVTLLAAPASAATSVAAAPPPAPAPKRLPPPAPSRALPHPAKPRLSAVAPPVPARPASPATAVPAPTPASAAPAGAQPAAPAVAQKAAPTPSAAAASPAPSPPVETGVSISATYAASNRRPVQPAVSRRFGEEGTVRLNVLVRADGTAGTVEIKTSSGFPLLDETARSAVESWRFNPATQDGKPVQKWYIVPIVFKLEN